MTRPNKKKTVLFDPEYDQKLLDVVLDVLAAPRARLELQRLKPDYPFKRFSGPSEAGPCYLQRLKPRCVRDFFGHAP